MYENLMYNIKLCKYIKNFQFSHLNSTGSGIYKERRNKILVKLIRKDR